MVQGSIDLAFGPALGSTLAYSRDPLYGDPGEKDGAGRVTENDIRGGLVKESGSV